MEEISSNLYRIEIPLPESPLKYLNSYVIKTDKRNLIIDTGLDRTECLEVMQAGLKKLTIDLRNTDFFITHLHGDHSGLVPKMATDTSKIYFNQIEMEVLKSKDLFNHVISYNLRNGFPEDKVTSAFPRRPDRRFGSTRETKLEIKKDGDAIHVGDYSFTCVETAGHSPGHMCLYEPDKKILVAGDHLLIDITPGILCHSDEMNPLRRYLSSLDKVEKLEVRLVLPGHRRLFKNHRRRIRELKEHHQSRLEEVLSILSKGAMSAFQVASKMTWDVRSDSWDQVPEIQKWFATGEAIAHLRYLEEEGRVFRNSESKMTTYTLVTKKENNPPFRG